MDRMHRVPRHNVFSGVGHISMLFTGLFIEKAVILAKKYSREHSSYLFKCTLDSINLCWHPTDSSPTASWLVGKKLRV